MKDRGVFKLCTEKESEFNMVVKGAEYLLKGNLPRLERAALLFAASTLLDGIQ